VDEKKLQFSVAGILCFTHSLTLTRRVLTCVSDVTEYIFGAFCFVVKRSECEADRSLPSAVDITNCWRFTVTRS